MINRDVNPAEKLHKSANIFFPGKLVTAGTFLLEASVEKKKLQK